MDIPAKFPRLWVRIHDHLPCTLHRRPKVRERELLEVRRLEQVSEEVLRPLDVPLSRGVVPLS